MTKREENRRAIIDALAVYPNLSNRAIARMTGTNYHSVRRVRLSRNEPLTPRVEVSGRRARGRQPELHYYEESLPDGSATLYRCYHNTELLYIGASIMFILRLAKYNKKQWLHEITQITLAHFDTVDAALEAERLAIKLERPKYNVVSKLYQRADERAIARALLKRPGATAPAPAVSPTPSAGPHQPAPGVIKRPTGRMLV